MSAAPPSRGAAAAPANALRRFEFAALLLLLVAALVPRARRLADPFDGTFTGYQGAFFAIAAVGYERFGVARFAGYPALALDGPSLGGMDDVALVEADGGLVAVYRNHPPLSMLLAWASIAAFAPDGWSDAWRSGEPPRAVEAPERAPFLALHLAGLLALWWAVREGFGASAALAALALYAFAPVALVCGPRANLETPSLPFVLAAVALHARWLRDGRPRALALAALALAAGAAFTWAPALYAPVLASHALARRGARAALGSGLALSLACALPLGAHALLSRASGAPPQDFLARAGFLLGPLFDGSAPPGRWLALQLAHANDALGPVLLAAAALGFALLHARRVSPALDRALARNRAPGAPPAPLDVATPILAGAGAYLACFWRHTFEDQPNFLLYLAPAAAAHAAVLCDALAGPLLRLRAGVAPHVALCSGLALAGLAATDAWRAERQRERGAPEPRELAREVVELVPREGWTAAPLALGLDFPTAFYAWRNLVPVRSGAELSAVRRRLEGARAGPGRLLLPRDDPERSRPAATELRRETSGTLAGGAGRWALWRMP